MTAVDRRADELLPGDRIVARGGQPLGPYVVRGHDRNRRGLVLHVVTPKGAAESDIQASRAEVFTTDRGW